MKIDCSSFYIFLFHFYFYFYLPERSWTTTFRQGMWAEVSNTGEKETTDPPTFSTLTHCWGYSNWNPKAGLEYFSNSGRYQRNVHVTYNAVKTHIKHYSNNHPSFAFSFFFSLFFGYYIKLRSVNPAMTTVSPISTNQLHHIHTTPHLAFQQIRLIIDCHCMGYALWLMVAREVRAGKLKIRKLYEFVVNFENLQKFDVTNIA